MLIDYKELENTDCTFSLTFTVASTVVEKCFINKKILLLPFCFFDLAATL